MKKSQFLIEHWGDRLIKLSKGNVNKQSLELTEKTIDLLSTVGLPVILSTELKKSFLPFTYFSKMQVQDKNFYIIGDISSSLSGIVLLGLEIGSENVYEISRNHETKYAYYFMNENLEQFLLFLAHYNIVLEEENKRIKTKQRQTAEEARAEYEALKDQFNQIDSKATVDIGFGWGHLLDLFRMDVLSLEYEETGQNISYDDL